MKRVLFVGQTPETVDFSDPALPPNFNAEKIHAGIAVAMRQMTDRGWQGDVVGPLVLAQHGGEDHVDELSRVAGRLGLPVGRVPATAAGHIRKVERGC